jgi:hypothetical protein
LSIVQENETGMAFIRRPSHRGVVFTQRAFSGEGLAMLRKRRKATIAFVIIADDSHPSGPRQNKTLCVDEILTRAENGVKGRGGL